MKKILILGHNGMLGNAVHKHLQKTYEIETINDYRWGDVRFLSSLLLSDAEFIINCIGAIPQKKPKDDYYQSLNVDLPIYLESKVGKKIIHPSTDCIFSGKLEHPIKYKKTDIPDAYDLYGKSKAEIDVKILDGFTNTKMIRTSIFGHELSTHVSLLDWFLNTADDEMLNGYSNYYWNGISTFQWAKEAEKLIENWDTMPVLTQLGSEGMSKSEFLRLIANIYSKSNQINDFEMSHATNKVLESDYELPSLKQQLIELKEFYGK